MKLVRNLSPVMRVVVVGAICGIVASLAVNCATRAFADGPRPGAGSAPVLRNGGAIVQVAKVSAGPARNGVSQARCDSFAGLINDMIGFKMEALNDNNLASAQVYHAEAEAAEDAALDAGCFVIH
jgi:hypothetical protein